MPITTQVEPTVLEANSGYDGRYMAVIYNNDLNGFHEVAQAVSYATGCTLEEAFIETWEAHTYGKAAIHFGTPEVCCAVASIVSNIGVKTEVRPEW